MAEVLKSVAGQTGVTINIYTLQELGEAPVGVEVISEYIEEDDSPIEEEIELIDENLSYEERSEEKRVLPIKGSKRKSDLKKKPKKKHLKDLQQKN